MSFEKLKRWARAIKRDVVALWFAVKDSRTPWCARGVAAIVAAYALSPVDLVPDFIPVVGYLDDLLIVPLGILLAIKMIPPELMEEFRRKAEQLGCRPVSRIAAVFVVLLWMAGAIWLARWGAVSV